MSVYGWATSIQKLTGLQEFAGIINICERQAKASLQSHGGVLKECDICRSHKVVIFLLDELDIFARKPRQTLLYNLLDAMQTADMQVPQELRSDIYIRFSKPLFIIIPIT